MTLLSTELGNKGKCNLSKGIRPKLNVIEQLEFNLAYFEVTAQLFW